MAAEIKVLFEGIGNIKKQIEDSFKSSLKLKSKDSSAPTPDFKVVDKKTLDRNKKLQREIEKLTQKLIKSEKTISKNDDQFNKLNKSILLNEQNQKLLEISNKQLGLRLIDNDNAIENYTNKILKAEEEFNFGAIEKYSHQIEKLYASSEKITATIDKNVLSNKQLENIMFVTNRNMSLIPTTNRQLEIKNTELIDKLGSLKEKLESPIETKPSEDGKSGGMGVGAIAKGTFIGGALLSLVKGTKAISFLLETISGLINVLVGPFVPLILKVMTPLFKILLAMSFFMYNFFKDPLKALTSGGDTLLGGKGDKAQNNATKNIAVGAGAIGGGVIAGALAPFLGTAGIALGAMLGAWIADLGVTLFKNLFTLVATMGEKIAEFGLLMGEKLYDFGFIMGEKIYEFGFNLGVILADGVLYIYDKLKIAGDWLLDKVVVGMAYIGKFSKWIYDSMVSVLSGTWEILKGFADWIYTSLKDALSGTWDLLKDAAKGLVNAFVDMANWIIDKYNSIPVLGNVSNIPSINDGVISPAGKIVSVNPKDYLLASKNPRDLMGGNSGNNITINLTVQGNADKSVVDIIMKRLRTELSKKGAY